MLKIDSLNQFYGGSHILRNVNLSAEEGKLTVLLGRNGVGKTTLLRCLMGVVAAKNGQIAWRGQPLDALAPHARVVAGLAYVPQGRDIFPRLTVEENLLVGAASRKAPSKASTSCSRCCTRCARGAAATSPAASSSSSRSAAR